MSFGTNSTDLLTDPGTIDFGADDLDYSSLNMGDGGFDFTMYLAEFGDDAGDGGGEGMGIMP
jgi:hypothetical protein